MLFDDLLNNPAKWMVESRDEHDIVLTSRIRLARNLTATPFPGWATRQQREETLKLTSGEARQIPVMKGGYYAELSGLTQQQKQLLVERHLISRELAARSEGCAVLISRSQNASILFNEEDHLRLQYILPGIQLKKAWGAISKIDSELEARLPYIYLTMTLFASYLLRLWEKALDGPQNYDLNTTDSLAYTSGMYNAPDPNHESQNLDMKGGAVHV
mgnify:CR=1 FL=1